MYVILILISGILILLLIGKIIEKFGYNDDMVDIMRKHDVINAFLNQNSKTMIFFLFPIIMIIEELIFRYYLIGFLFETLKMNAIMVIFISSSIFSLYHIHTWFSYKNLAILAINIVYPFLLGLFISFIFLEIGILPCILIHYFVVLFIYYSISRRYYKKKE
ncbi:MAG: CPBP family intramembrane glutamic endopeptidase [Promethearchaeota archaeon]